MVKPDDINFQQAMAGVKRHRHDKHTSTAAKPRAPLARRIGASAPDDTELADLRHSSENEPGASQLYFARAGLQGQLRGLKQSRHFHLQDKLDLHGLRLHQAKDSLARFVIDARARQCRHVLIITGKGLHSADGQASLRAFTADWLKHHPAILAYTAAPQSEGGTGALVVLLKR